MRVHTLELVNQKLDTVLSRLAWLNAYFISKEKEELRENGHALPVVLDQLTHGFRDMRVDFELLNQRMDRLEAGVHDLKEAGSTSLEELQERVELLHRIDMGEGYGDWTSLEELRERAELLGRLTREA